MRHRLSPSGPFLDGLFTIANYGGGANTDPVDLDATGVVLASFTPATGTVRAGDQLVYMFQARCINSANVGVRRVTLDLQISGGGLDFPAVLPLDTLANAPGNERIITGMGSTILLNDDPTLNLVGVQDAGTDVDVPAEAAVFSVVAYRPIA